MAFPGHCAAAFPGHAVICPRSVNASVGQSLPSASPLDLQNASVGQSPPSASPLDRWDARWRSLISGTAAVALVT
jgi:hypothetical protein